MTASSAEIKELLDALEKLITSQVELRLASEEMKASKISGTRAARFDLERCIRRICGVGTQSQMLRAIAIDEEPDPFDKSK